MLPFQSDQLRCLHEAFSVRLSYHSAFGRYKSQLSFFFFYSEAEMKKTFNVEKLYHFSFKPTADFPDVYYKVVYSH